MDWSTSRRNRAPTISTVRFTSTCETNGYARSWHFSGYIQDDWRATDKLTLNLGLRYEYQTPMYMLRDRKVYFDTTTGLVKMVGEGPIDPSIVPVLEQYPGIAVKDGTIPRAGWHDDKNNFGPRFGFAYDFTGDGRTVVRGGGGVFYMTLFGGTSWANAYRAFPFIRNNTVFASTDPGNPNITLDNPFPEELFRLGISTDSAHLNMRTAYMTQQNLSISRQLDDTTVVEWTYAGTKGNKLQRTNRDLNAAVLGPGPIASRRPFPNFTRIGILEDSASSTYHSMQLRMDRRLSRGFSVLGGYTWSKSIDDESGQSSSVSGGNPQNHYNLKEQKGVSVWDRPHQLSAAFLWELPVGRNLTGVAGAIVKGWQINGIYTYISGQPYTPQLQGDNSLTGNGNDRPHLIGQWRLDDPDPNRWVNEAAFAIPERGTFGNAGRKVLRGRGTNNLDFAMAKSFPFREIPNFVEFRAEVFNIPNHPQFFLPNRFFNSAQFGTISRARDSRQIQLSLRFNF